MEILKTYISQMDVSREWLKFLLNTRTTTDAEIFSVLGAHCTEIET